MPVKSMLTAAAAALALAATASAANAGVLFTLPPGTPEMATPGFFDISFAAGAGPGSLSFQLQGFRTLDGIGVPDNFEDIFTLSLNGVEILRGSWDLGGGGQNVVFLADPSATINPQTAGIGTGGTVDITTPLALRAGTNILRFAYASAVPQAFTDEGWSLAGGATVTGAEPGAVPEPQAWGLMLLGFAGLGTRLRRRVMLRK